MKLILCLLLCATALSAQDAAAPLNPAAVEKVGELPPLTKVLNQRAATAFSKKDWATARKAYQEMIDLDPQNALVWANLGAVEQQAGDMKKAVQCFEKSVQSNPELASSWLALGLLRLEAGDTYLAISALARAVNEEPEDARAHNYLAIAAKNLGWADAAQAELQKALTLKPDYGAAHFNLALMMLDQRPPAIELAKRHYEKARALGMEKDEVVERRLKE
ncbi:MAG: tetratricopeptide repeat protein [Verrucomicrobiaceae bacterium]|nr:tetratricopeptide repeat protein [Verrucomicrobiaceae bacterium]